MLTLCITLYYNIGMNEVSIGKVKAGEECNHKLCYDSESNEHFCCKCGRVFTEEEVVEVERRRDRTGTEAEGRGVAEEGAGEVTGTRAETDRAEARAGARAGAGEGKGKREGEGAWAGVGVMLTATRLQDIGLDPRGQTNYWLTGLGTIPPKGYIRLKDDREELKSILSNLASKLRLNYHQLVELEKRLVRVQGKKNRAQLTYIICLQYLLEKHDSKKEQLADIIEFEFNTKIERYLRHEAISRPLWRRLYRPFIR